MAPTDRPTAAPTMRPARREDLPLLAQMNRHLIEDEGSDNPMDLTQLEARLRGWLEGGELHIDLFELHGAPIGYAVHRTFVGERGEETVHLRQLFIERPWRRQGLGRAAFARLRAERFAGLPVFLDVLASNPPARAFWRTLGFDDHATTLRLKE